MRSLETGVSHFHMPKFDTWTEAELLDYISVFRDDSIFAIAQLIRLGVSLEKLHEVSQITTYFLEALKNIVDFESVIRANKGSWDVLSKAKKLGFSDTFIAKCWGVSELEVFDMRRAMKLFPIYRMVDTCHTNAYIPYFYSTYSGVNQSERSDRRKIVVLGAGPIRIGQGVEFDYRPRSFNHTPRGLRGHHHQQQPRNRLHRLQHLRQAVFRAADR